MMSKEGSGSTFIDQEEFGIQPTCNRYSGGAELSEEFQTCIPTIDLCLLAQNTVLMQGFPFSFER